MARIHLAAGQVWQTPNGIRREILAEDKERNLWLWQSSRSFGRFCEARTFQAWIRRTNAALVSDQGKREPTEREIAEHERRLKALYKAELAAERQFHAAEIRFARLGRLDEEARWAWRLWTGQP